VKLLSTWFPAQHRATALGVLFGSFCLGSAFPQLLRGVAARHSWRVVVICTSAAAATSGTLVRALVAVGPFPFPATGSFSAAKSVAVLRNPNVGLAILAYCGHQCELFCVWTWAASFLENSWHISPTSAPLVAFVVISMGGPGSWVGGLLGDRYGHVRVAAISLGVSGCCVGALGLMADAGPMPIRLCLFVLWGLTSLSDSPQFSAIITVHADQEHVGTAITVQLLCGYLVTVLALWVVPVLANDISWRWSFCTLTVSPALGLLALLCLSRRGSGGPHGGKDCPPTSPSAVAAAGVVVPSATAYGRTLAHGEEGARADGHARPLAAAQGHLVKRCWPTFKCLCELSP